MKRAYCFGHISTGMLYRIKGNYPAAGGYGEIISAQRNFCGEALSTAVVLQRLGVAVALEGNWLGDNEPGRLTRAFMRDEGIDDSGVKMMPGYAGVEEIVISDAEHRTVFGPYEALLFTDRQWEMPTLRKIEEAHVVCADPSFGKASLQVVRQANQLDIPFVTIDAPFDSPLVQLAEVAIISEEFLLRTYDHDDLAQVFDAYLRCGNGLIVFTFGANEMWYGRSERKTMLPLKVTNVVETAGAGDSFRAGVMYGVLQGMNDKEMLDYACSVASCVIQSSPGVLGFSPKQLPQWRV